MSTHLTVAEVAREIGVDTTVIRRWIRLGHLPATRIGQRLWVLEPKAVEVARGLKRPVGWPAGRPRSIRVE